MALPTACSRESFLLILFPDQPKFQQLEQSQPQLELPTFFVNVILIRWGFWNTLLCHQTWQWSLLESLHHERWCSYMKTSIQLMDFLLPSWWNLFGCSHQTRTWVFVQKSCISVCETGNLIIHRDPPIFKLRKWSADTTWCHVGQRWNYNSLWGVQKRWPTANTWQKKPSDAPH